MVATTRTYHVAPAGDDQSNDGSAQRPFRTLQHCHNVAGTGGCCDLAPGVYRESVTISHDGASFRGRAGVSLSGLDRLDGLEWARTSMPGCVFRANLNASLPRKNCTKRTSPRPRPRPRIQRDAPRIRIAI